MTLAETQSGEVRIPKNMHLIEKANSLVFEYSWFKPKYIVSLVATPLFIYFLVNSSFILGDFSELTLPVYILLGLGAAVIYFSLAKLMNTTSIFVNNQEIVVRSGPLPWDKTWCCPKQN
ncbi:MAG: hypothetical protein HC819_00030 [Cyclobacteriaceae bacterium]|nr:hypothetical protein [Cyclobacteriaceae bacterium]